MKKIAIVFCFGLAAACGGSSNNSGGGGGNAILGSCLTNLTAGDLQIKTCVEFNAGTANSDAIANIKKDTCAPVETTGNKTASMSACDRTATIGGCQAPLNLTGATQTTWYFSPTTVEDGMKQCTGSGSKWITP